MSAAPSAMRLGETWRTRNMKDDRYLRIIAELCPNLHFLSLNSNFSYSTAKLEEECTNIELPILKQLETMYI